MKQGETLASKRRRSHRPEDNKPAFERVLQNVKQLPQKTLRGKNEETKKAK